MLSRIDDVVDWAETGVKALARDETLLTSDSALARWARAYAADVTPGYDHGSAFDRIEIQGGEFDRYQVIKILRGGYEAARAAGPQTARRFLDAKFIWHEPDNERIEAVSAFTYYGTSLRVLGTPVRPID